VNKETVAPIVGVSSTVIVDADAVPLGFGDISFLVRRGDIKRRTPFFLVGVEKSLEDESDMEADDVAAGPE
jgi:hypothetical protein